MKSTVERGYGYEHRRRRASLRLLVEAGHATCSRCGHPIWPGAKWDLDHTDDRTGYAGPAHARCNRRAGGRKGARVTNGRKRRRLPVFGPV